MDPASTTASCRLSPLSRSWRTKSHSTIALLTTIPAREITPMPVMMIPNAVPVSINPQSTPITDRATEVMIGERQDQRVELGDQHHQDEQ